MLYAIPALLILIVSILLDTYLYNLVTSHRITVKWHNAWKKANDTISLALIVVLIMLCFTSTV